jgi:hypothetical protein
MIGNYPMPDHGHAVSAKRFVRKNRKDGNLTKDEFGRIERKPTRSSLRKADPLRQLNALSPSAAPGVFLEKVA